MRLHRAAAVVLIALTACGCGRSGPSPAPANNPAAALATIEVAPARPPGERVVVGVVEAVHQATLSAQTAGRVAEVLVDVNDPVAAGALVMRLHSTEQVAGFGQSQAGLKAAAARDAQARAQFDRIRDMYERRVVARATYDEAVGAREAASAQLAGARAGLDAAREGVAYTELRSPYAGVVTARQAQPGEAVVPGTPLITIASLDRLRVVAEVPQSLAPQVRALRQAVVHIGDAAIVCDQLTLFPSADPQSGTFRARVALPRGVRGFAPGMFVRVGFQAADEAERLMVPRRAVVERSELRALYVVGSDGRVALRQVRLGRITGDNVEVLAGLVKGERVAVDPAVAGLLARSPAGKT